MLAEALIAAGHEVVWWTDDFDHFRKEHRFGKDHQEELLPGLTVRWIHTPGYKQNTSPVRFRDHKILARRVESLCESMPKPQVIVAGIPTDYFCALAVRLGKKYQAASLLDVRDFWPDVFFSLVPKWMAPAVWLCTRPMNRRVSRAFANATAIAGTAPGMLQWGLDKGNRDKTDLDQVFPIGSISEKPPEAAMEKGREFWDSLGIRRNDRVFRICFFGTLGPLYNYETVINAARLLMDDEKPVEFIFGGMGKQFDTLIAKTSELPNVKFPGWIDQPRIWSLMELSSLGILPYIEDPSFKVSLSNKAGEYLSGYLPILSAIEGYITELITQNNCGQRYESPENLVQIIRTYRDDASMLEKQKENASKLFNEKLAAAVVYPAFVKYLENLAESALNSL